MNATNMWKSRGPIFQISARNVKTQTASTYKLFILLFLLKSCVTLKMVNSWAMNESFLRTKKQTYKQESFVATFWILCYLKKKQFRFFFCSGSCKNFQIANLKKYCRHKNSQSILSYIIEKTYRERERERKGERRRGRARARAVRYGLSLLVQP